MTISKMLNLRKAMKMKTQVAIDHGDSWMTDMPSKRLAMPKQGGPNHSNLRLVLHKSASAQTPATPQ